MLVNDLEAQSLSGLAKRGFLLRVLQLADAQAQLFDGDWQQPGDVTFPVYGGPSDRAIELGLAMNEEGARHG